MNELNYATLEASKRLVDAGIVLETEAWWMLGFDEKYSLVHCATEVMREVVKQRPGSTPAPTMAEVWRELPAGTEMHKRHSYSEAFLFADTDNADSIYPPCNSLTNPTDALIDLLILVGRDFNAKHDCP